METYAQFKANNAYKWHYASEKEIKANYEKAKKIEEIYKETYNKPNEPQIGDIVEFADRFTIYKDAKIVENHYFNKKQLEHGMITICERGSSFTDGKSFSTSGGAMLRFNKSKLIYKGKTTNMVWTWDIDGPGANHGMYFTIQVNKWEIPYEKEEIINSITRIYGKNTKDRNGNKKDYAVTIEDTYQRMAHTLSFESIKAYKAWANYTGYKTKKMDNCLTLSSHQKIKTKYISNKEELPKNTKPIKCLTNGKIENAYLTSNNEEITYYIIIKPYKQKTKEEIEKEIEEYRKYSKNPMGV